MKILVTGVGRKLGYDAMKVIKERNVYCICAYLREFVDFYEENIGIYSENLRRANNTYSQDNLTRNILKI